MGVDLLEAGPDGDGSAFLHFAVSLPVGLRAEAALPPDGSRPTFAGVKGSGGTGTGGRVTPSKPGMNDLVNRAVGAQLRSQAGVIGRGQAFAAGLSADAVDRRIARRRWRPLHPRVYLDAGYDYGDEARVRAAALWAGPDAVLSGLAAAWWHGLVEAPPATVSLTVPRRRFPRAREGIAIRRRDLAAADSAMRGGLAVTAIPLTVLESAVELGESGAQFLERALLGPAGFAETVEAYRRNRTAAGAAAARALLLGAARRSVAVGERALVDLLRRARVIGWREGHPVAGFVVPLAFPAVRVAIEVEGWSWPAPVVQPARLAGAASAGTAATAATTTAATGTATTMTGGTPTAGAATATAATATAATATTATAAAATTPGSTPTAGAAAATAATTTAGTAGRLGTARSAGLDGIGGADERRRWRRAVLVRAGWTVVRLTRGEIETMPDVVLATIGAALARQRAG